MASFKEMRGVPNPPRPRKPHLQQEYSSLNAFSKARHDESTVTLSPLLPSDKLFFTQILTHHATDKQREACPSPNGISKFKLVFETMSEGQHSLLSRLDMDTAQFVITSGHGHCVRRHATTKPSTTKGHLRGRQPQQWLM